MCEKAFKRGDDGKFTVDPLADTQIGPSPVGGDNAPDGGVHRDQATTVRHRVNGHSGAPVTGAPPDLDERLAARYAQTPYQDWRYHRR